MSSATILWLAVAVAGSHLASADIVVTPVYDTSSLIANPAGPFSLALVFTDGSGSGDANNTATESDFSFGGGSGGPVTFVTGGASGGLGSSVVLKDSSFFNALEASFTPGNTLSFTLHLTTNLDAGGTPDRFSVVLLKADGSSIATTDPSGLNSLLTVDIDSANPSIAEFAVRAVPEPATFLGIVACLGLAALKRWRKSLAGLSHPMKTERAFR